MLRILLSLWLALAPNLALAGSTMTLMGVQGSGTQTYTGPADATGATALAAYSCARAYSSAYAASNGSLCDLVAVTGGAAVCTLKALTTGFVNLTSSACSGSTPAAACAAASGGSCKVSKAYNQVSPGTNDASQATLANMPAITFNALNGLPVMAFTSGSSEVLLSTSTFTQSQPFAMTAVFNASIGGGGFITLGSLNIEIRGAASANQAVFACGSLSVQNATNGSWHAGSVVCNNTSSITNLDGTNTTGLSIGGSVPNAQTLQIGKSSASVFITGSIAEDFFWSGALTTTQLSNLFTNQNGSNGYNGAL